MASKVTVISKGAVFMTDSLVKNLIKSGLPATVIEPDIKAIENVRKDTDIYLIYAGDYVFNIADVLIFLKDLLSEEDKLLGVVGYLKEIDEIKTVIQEKFISLTMERPFEMKKLIDELSKLSAKDAERKKGKNILLIDDDLTYLKTMQEWLSMKYNITITKSGMQAITYITNHTPDLILLDYEMPITTGPQVMEMLRSEPNSANIPIIFLTGRSDRESVMTVMALKPQGYMLKSMTKEQILETIDNFFLTKKWNNT
jgi:CheY-like chemotaxis protein